MGFVCPKCLEGVSKVAAVAMTGNWMSQLHFYRQKDSLFHIKIKQTRNSVPLKPQIKCQPYIKKRHIISSRVNDSEYWDSIATPVLQRAWCAWLLFLWAWEFKSPRQDQAFHTRLSIDSCIEVQWKIVCSRMQSVITPCHTRLPRGSPLQKNNLSWNIECPILLQTTVYFKKESHTKWLTLPTVREESLPFQTNSCGSLALHWWDVFDEYFSF